MKILIVCGGTGGHIFPAVSLAQELSKRGYHDIFFIIDDKMKTKDIIEGSGFRCEVLNVPKMPYGFSIKWLSFAIMLFISYLKAEAILTAINPDLVIGFGAYISWPIVSVAKSMKKKTLIHEQNVALGRANRMLLSKADRVCFSFPNKLLGKDKKYILTGNLVRSSLLQDLKDLGTEEALLHLGLSLQKKTILVLGGSKGASAINRLFADMSSILSEEEKERIQIIHITGDKDLESISEIYRAHGIKHWISSFYQRMGLLYKAADLAVCRSGATTIAELSIFGVPSIFIPYPGAGSHQLDNGMVLAKAGAAILLEQKKLVAHPLKKQIFDIIDDKDLIEKMSSAMALFARDDAAGKLADAVEELARC